jgi:hypothetical protein
MIDALIAGQCSPTVLAELPRGRARSRFAGLRDPRWPVHARLSRMPLDQIDALSARIDAAIASLPDSSAGDLATPIEAARTET